MELTGEGRFCWRTQTHSKVGSVGEPRPTVRLVLVENPEEGWLCVDPDRAGNSRGYESDQG